MLDSLLSLGVVLYKGMRRKRKQDVGDMVIESVVTEEGKSEVVGDASPRADRAPVSNRLSIPLTSDGRIDVDSMRSSTREKLEQAVRSSGLDRAPLAADFQLSRTEVAGLYACLGQFESWVVRRFYGVPVDIADRVFYYGDEDIAVLEEPTSKVVGKHASEWMRRYHDEIALAFALVAVHQRKVMLLFSALEERSRIEQAARTSSTPSASQAPVVTGIGSLDDARVLEMPVS